jgi:predicted AlkP superfamily pyrophosphatase or phosphodiesterase
MNKVILVLIDALGYTIAIERMGFLGHLVENKLASLYKVNSELPSMSRPIYETIHTGQNITHHGIISNQVIRLSSQPNIFRLAIQAEKTTAAAAYYWFSELYNRAPYDPIEDREVNDHDLAIQHGRFYKQDDTPDFELLDTARLLVRKYNPDYMLVHPMGLDHAGHQHGANSSQFRNHATLQDNWLSGCISEWMSLEYNILVTGDHGMNVDGTHGGTTSDVREVPLYLIDASKVGLGETGETLSQLQIAPTICNYLGLPVPGTMNFPSIN